MMQGCPVTWPESHVPSDGWVGTEGESPGGETWVVLCFYLLTGFGATAAYLPARVNLI